jgi:hypothetical protein
MAEVIVGSGFGTASLGHPEVESKLKQCTEKTVFGQWPQVYVVNRVVSELSERNGPQERGLHGRHVPFAHTVEVEEADSDGRARPAALRTKPAIIVLHPPSRTDLLETNTASTMAATAAMTMEVNRRFMYTVQPVRHWQPTIRGWRE